MKNFLLTVLILKIAAVSFAQQIDTQTKDSIAIAAARILIIPYEPKMHLSDADKLIAEYSEKNPHQIRMMFRTGITNQLQAALAKTYTSHSMLSNLTPAGMKALDEVYREVNYSYDTVYSVLHPVQVDKHKKDDKKPAVTIDADDIRYMNVQIAKEVIEQLCSRFDATMVVFLSQVEIKTRYAECLDASLNIYPRSVKVHYTVFDSGGKQVYGGIAKASMPSSSNEIGEIMANSFPVIVNEIKGALPVEKKTLAEK